MEPQASPPRTTDAGERASSLPWLFPWVLAIAGILITLILMR